MKSFLYPVLSLMALLGLTLHAQETAMPDVPPIPGIPAAAHQAAASIDPQKIGAHVRFLASDLLEGRGPGTRGGQLAAEYIATQFALAGARPAGENGSYFQRVPMVGAATQSDATLAAQLGGNSISFRWLEDFVGVSQLQQPADQFDADLVF